VAKRNSGGRKTVCREPTVGLTVVGRIAIYNQVRSRFQQRARHVVPDHVVVGSVPDHLAKYGADELDGVRRERLASQPLGDVRTKQDDYQVEMLPGAGLE